MKTLNTAFVREQFPAFSEPSLVDWAFFENAGGSYTCNQVLDKLTGYYSRLKVQPYHAYPAARRAGEAMDSSYTSLAEYLNVQEGEIHLGPSTTQNTYVLAQAFMGILNEGDEIIVTNQDHEANSGVWRKLVSQNIVVKEWRVDPDTGKLNPEELDDLLNEKTKLVAYPHCSNIVAHWNPVRALNDKIHAHGAIAIVDGVASAPHGLPDIQELDADVYLVSLYKTWGPHLGLMTIKEDLLDKLTNQGHFFHADLIRKKLVPAGPDHAQIAAAKGVVDYLDTIYNHHYKSSDDAQIRRSGVNQLIKTHEDHLLTMLLNWLRERDDIKILGPYRSEERAPTVSIIPLKKEISDIQNKLTERKIMTGVAHFYAPRLLEAMQCSPEVGVLRMSFLHYTTEAELGQLIETLKIALD